MARRKPTVNDPRETPQASVEEVKSAVTAPEPTPPASPSAADEKRKTRIGSFTRIDH